MEGEKRRSLKKIVNISIIKAISILCIQQKSNASFGHLWALFDLSGSFAVLQQVITGREAMK